MGSVAGGVAQTYDSDGPGGAGGGRPQCPRRSWTGGCRAGTGVMAAVALDCDTPDGESGASAEWAGLSQPAVGWIGT